MTDEEGQITRWLQELSAGNQQALDRLMPLVYEPLRRLAHQRLRRERSGHTLGTTALVHEAYLKLVDQRRVRWQDRAHFYAVASMAMRRILVNYAKMRGRDKRGGGAVAIPLDEDREAGTSGNAVDVVALDEVLLRLATLSERACRVVECRYFGGLSIEETAEALGVAPMTVKRDWLLAKTWLHRELGPPA
jgi:RNA polymerase sigma factor (TIGR02999 family)